MPAAVNTLPIVRSLPDDFSLPAAFDRLAQLPGVLWFDSAAGGPAAESDRIGRYSFLTADPVRRFSASITEPNPWPQLHQWARQLPGDYDPALPPFQGGIAGLIGYEAAAWLEQVGVARINDLPTPAMSLGLYDWTIAVDHQVGRSWLISQGLGVEEAERRQQATRRADQIASLLQAGVAAEPCSCRRVAGDADAPSDQFPTSHVGITSNFSSAQFRARVAEIVRRIRDGDSFQVNLAQRLLCPADLSSPQLYHQLRAANPAPFNAYYCGGDFQVLSSSPEGFLTVRDRVVQTRPIKGTIPRTGDAVEDERLAEQLSRSAKDRAENVMIVDLMRNDLSRVCEDDSVVVRRLCQVERYQYVQHLVSVVEGQLRDDQSVADVLQSCFPGGSVTGAPKIEAMRTIAALEPHRRGPYCGSLGYISCGGSADFSILIRTITAAHGYWQIPVGGGITAQSDPAAEEAETWSKAEGMLRALQ
jgi:para-aminobenzoate synthetase component 1